MIDFLKKIKSIIKKVLIILGIVIFNSLGFLNSVYAANINTANLHSTGDCGELLKYKGIVVKVSYVEYINGNEHYPAYCLDKTKPGAETKEYSVSVNNTIKDVGLWRIIINGYPYKTIKELGVANKEEAFTATKQAVYCYIHGNNPKDYTAIGEAGKRTLSAMNKIISNANSSNETKISSTIKINKNVEEWKQDNIDKNYLSKIYTISAGTTIQNYKIKLTKDNGQDIGGIKITDEKNNEKQEFSPNEKFKVLIPIKNMNEKGNFRLEVEAKIKTKPVLYGIAPDSNYQDYALTFNTYEDGQGYVNDQYYKNETKIIILKQDEETKERIPNVEFELLNENKETIYTELKTNQEGKITLENIIPGKYYLKEMNSVDGYEKYEELIEINIELNEQLSVIVNNRKEEGNTDVEITKNKISVSNKEVKKLPVTGM